ncbi:hypothetical protein Godav_015200 [Gossypium davidsonii]|uniref:Uncharacterized protein n=1 Tax=Gossypium davidsonii TaxID=34287 RepID=A0A7J8RMC6_GOSDV|nr:hypothetical protein [Gossypium davidsonii]
MSTMESFIGSANTVVERSLNPFAFATQKRTVTLPALIIAGEDGVPVENPMYARILGTQSTTKAIRHHSLCHHFKKNDLTISAYLAGIKHLCNSLAGCGHHVSVEEHQSTILNGLPFEFDHVVSIIRTNHMPFDLHEITSALLDADASQQAHITHLLGNITKTDKRVSPVIVDEVDLVVEHGRNARFLAKLVILHGSVAMDMMTLQMRMLCLDLVPAMDIWGGPISSANHRPASTYICYTQPEVAECVWAGQLSSPIHFGCPSPSCSDSDFVYPCSQLHLFECRYTSYFPTPSSDCSIHKLAIVITPFVVVDSI